MNRYELLLRLGLSDEQIAPLLTADIGRIIVDGTDILIDENSTVSLLVTFPCQFPCSGAPETMLIDAGGQK